ncbi:hypothetical protein C4D60_Mb02t13720 [Musa balbisiana]|uniref:AN1-type domain-containing protein n=1 Tax=Musa balbisiana TaxID=52838 RepID=A0A4S8IAG7_MUSBA|nr:hypothetical protein C4D60_Mb02t13720 [Musa balbisiana]
MNFLASNFLSSNCQPSTMATFIPIKDLPKTSRNKRNPNPAIKILSPSRPPRSRSVEGFRGVWPLLGQSSASSFSCSNLRFLEVVTTPAEAEKTTSIPSSSVKIEPTVISSDEVDGPCDMKVVKDQAEDLCNKQPANRCFRCRKKVGLTGFKCRCENTLCSAHRHPEAHECSFDYKIAGRKAIAKENPVVKAEKINKI